MHWYELQQYGQPSPSRYTWLGLALPPGIPLTCPAKTFALYFHCICSTYGPYSAIYIVPIMITWYSNYICNCANITNIFNNEDIMFCEIFNLLAQNHISGGRGVWIIEDFLLSNASKCSSLEKSQHASEVHNARTWFFFQSQNTKQILCLVIMIPQNTCSIIAWSCQREFCDNFVYFLEPPLATFSWHLPMEGASLCMLCFTSAQVRKCQKHPWAVQARDADAHKLEFIHFLP